MKRRFSWSVAIVSLFNNFNLISTMVFVQDADVAISMEAFNASQMNINIFYFTYYITLMVYFIVIISIHEEKIK